MSQTRGGQQLRWSPSAPPRYTPGPLNGLDPHDMLPSPEERRCCHTPGDVHTHVHTLRLDSSGEVSMTTGAGASGGGQSLVDEEQTPFDLLLQGGACKEEEQPVEQQRRLQETPPKLAFVVLLLFPPLSRSYPVSWSRPKASQEPAADRDGDLLWQ